MKTLIVRDELTALNDTFLGHTIQVNRPWCSRDRYGRETWMDKSVSIEVVNFQGFALLELKLLIRIFQVLKQTKVKSVRVEKHQDGVRIAGERFHFFLKGLGHG